MAMKFITGAALGLGLAGMALAQDAPMFGGEEDQAYAQQVWQAMTDQHLAGDGAIMSFPYPGTDPHGMMLETFYTTATIDGHEGALVVKRNYGPEGVSVDEVLGAPAEHLGALTIMFQREAGYDDETGNWFYAKYLPDGSLDQSPDGMALAGLVGKNAEAGCIACHQNAGGDDYLFTTDAEMGMMME
ncbi:cytochrome P460 family protein [Limimaricola soesokkakensis]|uniref:cytochrome P460 family protein n=1 Tax=Limimaricola soesokkakensis TaxID=1343159 RepID=UPI003511FAE3